MTGNKKTIILDEIYPSSQEKRKDHIDNISEIIINSGLSLSVTRDELYLILDEAITNAMEHGNNWDPAKTVHICAYADEHFLYLDIIDQGQGFNSKLYEENLKKRNVLSIRGRGLFIINQFCNLHWDKKGTKLTLELKLKK